MIKGIASDLAKTKVEVLSMWHTANDSEKRDSWPKLRNATLLTVASMLMAIIVDLLFGT